MTEVQTEIPVAAAPRRQIRRLTFLKWRAVRRFVNAKGRHVSSGYVAFLDRLVKEQIERDIKSQSSKARRLDGEAAADLHAWDNRMRREAA